MGILDKVLSVMSLTESSPQVLYAIERVEAYIKEYCGLAEIPESAATLWCEMVCDLLRGEETAVGDFDTNLSALSMGDVSYTFDTKSEKSDVNTILGNYQHRLNLLRKGLFR